MAILNFTLSPDALSKLHDALVCLGKFSEAVSMEAVHDKVCHVLDSLGCGLLMEVPACSDCSQFIQVRVCLLYLSWEQVFLQIPLQRNQRTDQGKVQLQDL